MERNTTLKSLDLAIYLLLLEFLLILMPRLVDPIPHSRIYPGDRNPWVGRSPSLWGSSAANLGNKKSEQAISGSVRSWRWTCALCFVFLIGVKLGEKWVGRLTGSMSAAHSSP